MVLRAVPERLPQEIDVPGEIAFFDERVGPQPFDEVLLG
jgi:hypothetical protein